MFGQRFFREQVTEQTIEFSLALSSNQSLPLADVGACLGHRLAQRLNRTTHAGQRRKSIALRALTLRHFARLLGRRPASIEFDQEESGRPTCRLEGQEIFISLSGTETSLAVATSPALSCGIDLVQLGPQWTLAMEDILDVPAAALGGNALVRLACGWAWWEAGFKCSQQRTPLHSVLEAVLAGHAPADANGSLFVTHRASGVVCAVTGGSPGCAFRCVDGKDVCPEVIDPASWFDDPVERPGPRT